MQEKIKVWLVKQVEAGKFAWTIIVIIAGLVYGQKAELIPMGGGVNTQQTIEKRLINLENSLPNNPNVDKNVTDKVLSLHNKLKKDLADLEQFMQEQKNVKPTAKTTTNDSYVLPEPKVPT